jgi:hypothetical protein
MKKVAVLVAIMLCVVMAGAALAVPQSQTVSTKQTMVDRNGDNKIDGVDIYDESGKVVKRGYDTDGDMIVDRWETYDENTGMPIVTESDKSFELR